MKLDKDIEITDKEFNNALKELGGNALVTLINRMLNTSSKENTQSNILLVFRKCDFNKENIKHLNTCLLYICDYEYTLDDSDCEEA